MREERLRDLGGLALEMYKRDRFNAGLVVERCAELVAIEARVQEIDALLDGSARVRRGGGGALCICGAPILLGARYCASCGRTLGGASLDVAHVRIGRACVTTCPRCREPLASGQEYCLTCGARVSDAGGIVSRPSLSSGWTLRSAVAAVVALLGAAAAIAATNDSRGSATVVTAIGGFATAPQSTTGEAPVGPSGLADWPTGADGWTIALASLPQTGGRAAAVERARAARAKGLTQVGVLDSSRYASLHPGYWIVFSGVYASEAEATSELEAVRRTSRTAAVRRVVP